MLSGSTSSDSVPSVAMMSREYARVRLEPGEEHGRRGAEPARAAHRHRGARPRAAGLVGRRGDDTARAGPADEHRSAAQGRLVALLDGGEEGVRVGVQHGRAGAQPGGVGELRGVHAPTVPRRSAASHATARPPRWRSSCRASSRMRLNATGAWAFTSWPGARDDREPRARAGLEVPALVEPQRVAATVDQPHRHRGAAQVRQRRVARERREHVGHDVPVRAAETAAPARAPRRRDGRRRAACP